MMLITPDLDNHEAHLPPAAMRMTCLALLLMDGANVWILEDSATCILFPCWS